MKAFLVLAIMMFLSACTQQKPGKIEFEGQKEILCKNEKGDVVLAAAVQEAELLENGNYRVRDMNGSYLVTKGECKLSEQTTPLPKVEEKPSEEPKKESEESSKE